MSTRAIIAMPVKNGFETAWCWNDGGPANLGAQLRQHFKTEKDVEELIKLHSFSSIIGPQALTDLIVNGYFAADDRVERLNNNRLILKHKHDGDVIAGTGENGFFENIEEMLNQDLNYVYVFRDGKWVTYK